MNETKVVKQEKDKKYEKPSVTADITLFSVCDRTDNAHGKTGERGVRLLMIRRGRPPYQGMYALPGGFAEPGETVDQTALRELKEETNVDCPYLQQLRTFSEPGRDPRGWVITCVYIAVVDAGEHTVMGGDDASEALWFDVSLESEGEEWRLELRHEEQRLRAVLSLDAGAPVSEFSDWKIVSSDGLAFDHALIITSAVVKLRRILAEKC